MTKRYHLTQEQFLEIASNLELDGRDITVWTDGYVEFETKEALRLFANAVLDKVLGESVGDLIISNVEDELLFTQRWHRESIGSLPDGEHKLYAPKEKL